MDDPKRKRFLWGVVLSWSTLPPIMYGCANTFRGISEQKATGMAAVVGGLAEGMVWYGVFFTIVAQVSGIVLLVRGFSVEHTGRTVLIVASIFWSVLTLFLIVMLVWIWLKMPH